MVKKCGGIRGLKVLVMRVFAVVFVCMCIMNTVSVQSASAVTVGDTYAVSGGKINNVGNKETIEFGSEQYANFISLVESSILSDIKEGFDDFIGNTDVVVADHIKLKKWGKFLYDYTNKGVTLMPLGDIKLPLGNGYIFLQGDKGTKEWLHDEFIPLINNIILGTNDIFACNIYAYDISQALELEEFLLKKDDLKVKLVNSTHPFPDNGLYFYSMGESYGLQLNNKYVSTLNGLSDIDSTYRLLNRDKYNINVVNIFGCLVTPKIEQRVVGFNAKKLSDMSLYEGLGVSLIDGGVIKIVSADGVKIACCDDVIAKENFCVISLEDGLCVIPFKYKEAVNVAGYNVLTGVDLDITDYLLGGDIVALSNGEKENIGTYISQDNIILSERDSQGNFLMYAVDDKKSFGRVVSWLSSDDSKSYFSSEEIDNILGSMESYYKGRGKSSEWNTIANKYGVKTNTVNKSLKVVLGVILIGVSAVFIRKIIVKRKGLKSFNRGKGNLLFSLEKEEDDNYDG